jgi:hypothetical protein
LGGSLGGGGLGGGTFLVVPAGRLGSLLFRMMMGSNLVMLMLLLLLQKKCSYKVEYHKVNEIHTFCCLAMVLVHFVVCCLWVEEVLAAQELEGLEQSPHTFEIYMCHFDTYIGPSVAKLPAVVSLYNSNGRTYHGNINILYLTKAFYPKSNDKST